MPNPNHHAILAAGGAAAAAVTVCYCMKKQQGESDAPPLRESDTPSEENTLLCITEFPATLQITNKAMPYTTGSYSVGEAGRQIGWNGMPVWVSDFEDEGERFCLYSDGERWKIGAHTKEDLENGRGWCKGLHPHNGVLPHLIHDPYIRPGLIESEPSLVTDHQIFITLPGIPTSYVFSLNDRVKVMSSETTLAGLYDDLDMSFPSVPLSSLLGKTGKITGFRPTEDAPLIIVTTDDGEVLPGLPEMAVVSC
eukprot:TRINITY_DN6595_c1_g1_i1.p1 TRINITY_DN6595_c1_g1~~TRINITY_DN6595_c1_g1_i1.p1  ORF type:complete len:252 (+),score=34.38 TRINITY_DN6595_c1_g1_i1:71-826(+)